MTFATLAVLLLLPLVAACRGAHDTSAGAASNEAGSAVAPLPAEASAPLDHASVAAALEDDAALERANTAAYRERQASMATYAECMVQVEGLPEPVRARIAEACARLPDAPGR